MYTILTLPVTSYGAEERFSLPHDWFGVEMRMSLASSPAGSGRWIWSQRGNWDKTEVDLQENY